MLSQPVLWKVVAMLAVSNTFMTFAWYGHLKYLHGRALPLVILISWGIAFFEYCFAVPANRIGSEALSGFQLKIVQEIVTLTVFVGFARFVLGEKLRWNHGVSFLLIAAAAYFAFAFSDKPEKKPAPPAPPAGTGG